MIDKLSNMLTLGTVDNFFISKGKIIIPYNSIEQSNEESNSKPKLDPEPKEDLGLEGYDAKSIYRQ